jgi:hypothetical protein
MSPIAKLVPQTRSMALGKSLAANPVSNDKHGIGVTREQEHAWGFHGPLHRPSIGSYDGAWCYSRVTPVS